MTVYEPTSRSIKFNGAPRLAVGPAHIQRLAARGRRAKPWRLRYRPERAWQTSLVQERNAVDRGGLEREVDREWLPGRSSIGGFRAERISDFCEVEVYFGLQEPKIMEQPHTDAMPLRRVRSILLDYNTALHLLLERHATLLVRLRRAARDRAMPIWSSIELISEFLYYGSMRRRQRFLALLRELSDEHLLGSHVDVMSQWVAEPTSRSVNVDALRWSGSNAATIDQWAQDPPAEVRAWIEEGQRRNATFFHGMSAALRKPAHKYDERIRPQNHWRYWDNVIDECSWLAAYMFDQPRAIRRLLGGSRFEPFSDVQLQASMEHPFMALYLRHIAWGLFKVLQLRIRPDNKFLRGDFLDRIHLVHSCAADIFVTEDSGLREFCEAHRRRYGVSHAMSLDQLNAKLATQDGLEAR